VIPFHDAALLRSLEVRVKLSRVLGFDITASPAPLGDSRLLVLFVPLIPLIRSVLHVNPRGVATRAS
jgi:hypothetical protein